VAFVLVAEAALFVPTMGSFRQSYLRKNRATAHSVMTVLEALPLQINPTVCIRFLEQCGMLGIKITHQNGVHLR
jgi:hypothetical protein